MENLIDHQGIGCLYNPRGKQNGNYVPGMLSMKYDAFIHLYETVALYPLHIERDDAQIFGNYSFGM